MNQPRVENLSLSRSFKTFDPVKFNSKVRRKNAAAASDQISNLAEKKFRVKKIEIELYAGCVSFLKFLRCVNDEYASIKRA